ncbi:extracellular solute-binding protein [Paenibacillus sp. J2TS4]|uniref:extracellular solute-binding protein n=1 Tax=Paenibacillus sp. J2TS4 TaxID=2807194 RepID=UPI001B1DB47C|nr:extracellular solute-binding protein [Paenibacillus sp. J2TS4]GIP31602.1 hypothetical protein J2TS4_08120 [Paenibacillus sp. J2TS4]
MLRRRNNFQERYNRFLQELRDEIVSGELAPGEYILPEGALGEKYGMSRMSIRKALSELVEDGMIEKIPGKGNRITTPAGEQPPILLKLAWFSNSYEIGIVRRILTAFEAKYPNVKVELILLPEDEYTDSVIRMIEQEQSPDVFMLSDQHVREWIDSGKTDYVTGYVPEHLDPQETSYPQIFEIFMNGERMLAAPFIFSPVVIVYNRSIFKQNGINEEPQLKDWSDLLDFAKRCTRDINEDGVVEQYGFCFSSSMNRWPVFLLQNGGELMANGRSTLSRQENIEALGFCTSLMYEHKVSPIYSHGSSHLAESLFVKERVAMIMTTYYFMNEFRDQSIEWDVLPVPKQQEQATLLLGGGLAINSVSEHMKLSQRLVEFMTGTEAQTLIKRYGCTIPVLRSVAENDDLLDPAIHPAHYGRFLDVLPYSRSLKSLQLSQSETTRLFDELNLLWAGMEKPEEACLRIEKKLNELRKKKQPLA